MFFTHILVGLFDFTLAVVMSALIIFLTYRVFIAANPDFDMEEEIRKGNVAVGTLVAAILFAASMILQKGMDSVVGMVRLRLIAPAETGFTLWQLLWLCLGQLAMSMVLALLTVSITLRLFGRLARVRGWRPGAELQRGNLAAGILLSAAVVVASLYVGEGVSALSKALTPQPVIGQVQIMR